MNEFDDIEKLLGRMPLAAPPARLDQAVAKTIRRSRSWMWLGAGALAAAAAVVLAFWIGGGSPTDQPVQYATTQIAPQAIEFIETEQHWVDEGIVAYSADGPVRQYRLQSIQPVAQLGETVVDEQVVQYVSAAY